MLEKLLFLILTVPLLGALANAQGTKTRLAVVGLDHDHVWGMLKTIAQEPDAELVAIADPHPDLVAKAKAQVPASVKFYADYVQMLDEAKPEAVIVTTANDRHLAILRECAKRHIHHSTEKPMAASGADAREMLRLAHEAKIKLMVNYWNAWAPATQEAYRRLKEGGLGPVQKMIIEFGHQGPKEIGTSKYFTEWLYDPAKNGAGALMDFGCYGADWALWVKGRPRRVYAYSLKLKTAQHNAVEDDAVVLLEYPDATAVLLPSWDWPYGLGQAQFFGPKGSFLVMGDGLLFAPAKSEIGAQDVAGKPVECPSLPPEKRNPIAYFLYCVRNNKPIEGMVAPELNVGVNEIIDAAKESIRTGRAVELR
ncbi:MAG: Gfo/Idh/MocA family oxidoreductase [Acidobacteriia bacterium]|nr:Gfo/Idh/MocA family oxidoreductase [Terriglobia bacterium]